jgi:hypothetical protein
VPIFIDRGAPTPPKLRFSAIRYARLRGKKFVIVDGPVVTKVGRKTIALVAGSLPIARQFDTSTHTLEKLHRARSDSEMDTTKSSTSPQEKSVRWFVGS